jgi:hypothetical protein
MDFALRDAVESDLDQCLLLVTDRFLYDVAHLTALRRMWSHIVASQSGLVHVIADASDPSHVVHFGAMVFVSDESADHYHRCTSPKIAYRLLEEWDAGRKPFLTRNEIAKANAGTGLNLVVIHHGHLEPIDDESLERLRFASNEHAVRDFRGWNLRSYTNEAFTLNPERDGKEMGEVLGFRVGQYTGEQLREAGIPAGKRPYIWMATRQDVTGGPVGLALGMLFRSFSRPRFCFVAAEQDLLKLALDGHTDVTIASLMKSSLTTIKKRFRSIYEKVRVASAAWEEPLLSDPLTEGARGVETRRHLLSYLRNHPEELRPYFRKNGHLA